MTEAAEPARASGACPICGRPAAPAVSPFCSVRCADIDLGNWLTGVYAVPVDPEEEDAAAEFRIAAPD